MRALTVRQPWAWAIVHGGKTVENRTRNIAGAYRGPVAIHAGLTEAAMDTSYAYAVSHMLSAAGLKLISDDLPLGAIVGVANLIDVHRQDFLPSRDGDPDKFEQCSPWAQYDLRPSAWQAPHKSMWHMVLANARPLAEPIPYRGRLGLWTLPDDVTTALAAQTSRQENAS